MVNNVPQAEIEAPSPDFWFCPDRSPHQWQYRGKNKGYRCQHCGISVSKEALKAATDA